MRAGMSQMSRLWAVLICGFSPLVVYYHRMVIHEPLLVLGACGVMLTGMEWVRRPGYFLAMVMGIVLAWMASTKLTFLIYVTSWVVAAGFLLIRNGRSGTDCWKAPREWPWHAVTVLLAFSLTVGALFSSWGKHPQGVLDAIGGWMHYKTDPGHGHSGDIYLRLFFGDASIAFPHRDPLCLLAGLGGCLYSLWRGHPWGCFLAVSSLIQLFCHAVIAYKTPWLWMLFWVQWGCLGGLGLEAGLRLFSRFGKVLLLAGVGIAFWSSCQSCITLNLRYHSDARNPIAYAPTSRQLPELAAYLDRVYPQLPLEVYGGDVWPLPWYLRKRQVRYEGMAELVLPSGVPCILSQTAWMERLQRGGEVPRDFLPFALRSNVLVFLVPPSSL
jgi:hypothetical protein